MLLSWKAVWDNHPHGGPHFFFGAFMSSWAPKGAFLFLLSLGLWYQCQKLRLLFLVIFMELPVKERNLLMESFWPHPQHTVAIVTHALLFVSIHILTRPVHFAFYCFWVVTEYSLFLKPVLIYLFSSNFLDQNNAIFACSWCEGLHCWTFSEIKLCWLHSGKAFHLAQGQWIQVCKC